MGRRGHLLHRCRCHHRRSSLIVGRRRRPQAGPQLRQGWEASTTTVAGVVADSRAGELLAAGLEAMLMWVGPGWLEGVEVQVAVEGWAGAGRGMVGRSGEEGAEGGL
jgi:hypothetical protein